MSKFNDEATQELRKAIKADSLEEAKEAINNGADVNAQDIYEDAQLLEDNSDDDTRTVKFKNDTSINILSGSQGGLLQTINSDEGTITLRIKKGASVSIKGEYRDIPLLQAINNNIDMVTLLIDKGADVNAKNQRGDIALNTAISCNQVDIAAFLITKGAKVQDQCGNTVLHKAIIIGNPEAMIRKLMNMPELDKNMQDNLGNTVLMTAIINNNFDLAELLVDLAAGALNFNLANNNGSTAIALAMAAGDQRFTELLTFDGSICVKGESFSEESFVDNNGANNEVNPSGDQHGGGESSGY